MRFREQGAAFLAAGLILTGTAVLPGVLGLDGITARAETIGDFVCDVSEDGTVTITNYNGSNTDLVIPAEINGMPVTAVNSLIALYEDGTFDYEHD